LVRGAGVARLERELSIFPSSSRLKEGQKTNVSREKNFPPKHCAKTSSISKKTRLIKTGLKMLLSTHDKASLLRLSLTPGLDPDCSEPTLSLVWLSLTLLLLHSMLPSSRDNHKISTLPRSHHLLPAQFDTTNRPDRSSTWHS